MPETIVRRYGPTSFKIHSCASQEMPTIDPQKLDALYVDSSLLDGIDYKHPEKMAEDCKKSVKMAGLVKAMLKRGKPVIVLGTTMDFETPDQKIQYLQDQEDTKLDGVLLNPLGIVLGVIHNYGSIKEKRKLDKEAKAAELSGNQSFQKETGQQRKEWSRRMFLGNVSAGVIAWYGWLLKKNSGRILNKEASDIEQRNALVARAVEEGQKKFGGTNVGVIVHTLNAGVADHVYNLKTDAFKDGHQFISVVYREKNGK